MIKQPLSDDEAMTVPELDHVAGYLRGAGWSVQDEDMRTSLWKSARKDLRQLRIVLPARQDASDYADRIDEALTTLAYAEQRLPEEIAADMAFGGADTVAVRLTPDAPPGQAPLSLAQSAVTALRDFVVASAAGLDIRSLVLPARRPPRAEAYANEVRLSTQAGSFVMTLALPLLAAGISNETGQEDAGTPPMLTVPRQPFGRQITRRMQSVAQRAQLLADHVNDGRQHLRTFGQVSLNDVSPNATELEALNALGGPDHELYQLRFAQSPLAGERGQPVRIDVTPGQQRVLGDAALFLRTRQPRSDVTAQGLVVRLARATKLGPGEAVIEGYADDSGSRRRYHVELVEHDYNEAYRAHGAGLQVAATGDLDIRGTYLWLRPLRAFAVIPGFEYEDDVPQPEAITPD